MATRTKKGGGKQPPRTTAMRLLSRPLVRLNDAVIKLSTHERTEVADYLTDIAVRSASIAAYINTRTITGGDHADGVKRFNKQRGAIRKTVGYTYPNNMGEVRF